jgi:hypothetical protein
MASVGTNFDRRARDAGNLRMGGGRVPLRRATGPALHHLRQVLPPGHLVPRDLRWPHPELILAPPWKPWQSWQPGMSSACRESRD